MWRTAVLSLLVFCSACASAAGYSRMVQGWVGKSQRELVDGWGTPSWIEPHGREGMVLIYHRQDGELLNGREQVVMAQGDWCQTRFRLSKEGEITAAQWEGPACRG